MYSMVHGILPSYTHNINTLAYYYHHCKIVNLRSIVVAWFDVYLLMVVKANEWKLPSISSHAGIIMLLICKYFRSQTVNGLLKNMRRILLFCKMLWKKNYIHIHMHINDAIWVWCTGM